MFFARDPNPTIKSLESAFSIITILLSGYANPNGSMQRKLPQFKTDFQNHASRGLNAFENCSSLNAMMRTQPHACFWMLFRRPLALALAFVSVVVSILSGALSTMYALLGISACYGYEEVFDSNQACSKNTFVIRRFLGLLLACMALSICLSLIEAAVASALHGDFAVLLNGLFSASLCSGKVVLILALIGAPRLARVFAYHLPLIFHNDFYSSVFTSIQNTILNLRMMELMHLARNGRLNFRNLAHLSSVGRSARLAYKDCPTSFFLALLSARTQDESAEPVCFA